VLCEFGASQTMKCSKGLNARDYAVKRGKNKIVEFYDYVSPEEESEEEGDEPSDGLTSTQRSKLKKQQLKASEGRGTKGDAEAEEVVEKTVITEEDLAKEKIRQDAKGSAVWEELKALSHMEGKDVKEVTILKEEEAQCVEEGHCGVDPALWRCEFLTSVKLQMPPAKLTSLPEEIGQLKDVHTLILSRNALESLPEALGSLKSLRVLEVDNNVLASIPVALGSLAKLEVLNLSMNKLTTLEPLVNGDLPNLLTFSADFNQLAALDLPYASLARINSISVNNNELVQIDDGMGLLNGTLASLSLSNNKLESIAGIRDLKEKKLKVLNVDENPIADKKVFKLLRGDRPEHIIKELLKYLQKQGGGGGGKKKKK